MPEPRYRGRCLSRPPAVECREIVENHAPEHPAGSSWTIDPEPEIVLGWEETLAGGVNDQIQLVWDVVGVARIADGRVAVLSGQGRHLLLCRQA